MNKSTKNTFNESAKIQNSPQKTQRTPKKKDTWIWLWYQHLKLNRNYKKYCIYRKSGQHDRQKSLETQFPRIAEIYNDWGDLYFDEFGQKLIFKGWFSQNWQLFEPEETASVIEYTSANSSKDATIISIPHELPRKNALAQIQKLLIQKQSEGLHLAQLAKYRVYNDKRLDSSQCKALYKGLLVTNWLRMKESGSKDIAGVFDIVKAVALKEDKFWQWNFSEEEIADIRAGTMQSKYVENEKRQIKRLKNDAQTIIANTIHGVFPLKDKLL